MVKIYSLSSAWPKSQEKPTEIEKLTAADHDALRLVDIGQMAGHNLHSLYN